MRHLISVISFSFLLSISPDAVNDSNSEIRDYVGQFGLLSNPLNDLATGYQLQGLAKTAILNNGKIIDGNTYPSGLWKDYGYIYDVALTVGVPGQEYSSKYAWHKVSNSPVLELSSLESDIPGDWGEGIYMSSDWESQYSDILTVFCSEEAYEDWFLNGEETFAGVVFNSENDRGVLGQEVDSHNMISGYNQWTVVEGYYPSIICISVAYDQYEVDNPNKSNARIGLVYPWAKRPSLDERLDEFDLFDYGLDQNSWSADDSYVYYGATVSESWFSRGIPTDWQPSYNARNYTHNTDSQVNDVLDGTPWESSFDNAGHLLAHSSYPSTWPQAWNPETGEFNSYWPGYYAQVFDCELTDCLPCTVLQNDCYYTPGEYEGRTHVSDNDIYMEFDDRWAARANNIDIESETGYEQSGYPLGLKAKLTSYSFEAEYAEDVLFFSLTLKNESNEMILPDGTRINSGQGFDYKKVFAGFYLDADVLMGDINGYSGSIHTNSDDFMSYENFTFETPSTEGDGATDILRVSMAMIGDYDGYSGPSLSGYSMNTDSKNGEDFGLVGVQMLETPLATENTDLDQDGMIDIYEGEYLKMTGFHWFDWMGRPGIVGNSDIGGGSIGNPMALNKEEIQYKIMAGDTTNISDSEQLRFFHADPTLDELDPDFNPRFDNLEDLRLSTFFENDEDGLDCVLQMSTGPFDLDVGDEVNLSFAVLFGEDREDLISNAMFANMVYRTNFAQIPAGDVDMSLSVNILDIVLIVSHITESTPFHELQTSLADYNNDGYIDILDILLIISAVLDS